MWEKGAPVVGESVVTLDSSSEGAVTDVILLKPRASYSTNCRIAGYLWRPEAHVTSLKCNQTRMPQHVLQWGTDEGHRSAYIIIIFAYILTPIDTNPSSSWQQWYINHIRQHIHGVRTKTKGRERSVDPLDFLVRSHHSGVTWVSWRLQSPVPRLFV